MADDRNDEESVADLINEACECSVKAICALIKVPMLITAKCLKTAAESVENVCGEFEEGGKDKRNAAK
jgi:hypothetical protein